MHEWHGQGLSWGIQKGEVEAGVVAHTCNPSTLGGQGS